MPVLSALQNLSFREKMAWVMVMSLSIASSFFFYVLAKGLTDSEPLPRSLVIIMVVAFVILIVVSTIFGAVVSALTSVSEAQEPMDERDTLIVLKSSQIGALLTTSLVVLVAISYVFGMNRDEMFVGIMGALVVGVLAEYIAQIYFYRARV